ncbi:small glutamine-rich tetratricopeptide repeat-containing protein alpha-like isoform X2 [Sipha flava]|nr:small glutamine-rich tetratricopeptide repeat-containing protein alpha-like isoform X2 [Sipha flava]
MDDRRRIAIIIVNHLKNELKSGNFSEDSVESLEVAVQCLESAYSLNPPDSDRVHINLENIIKEFYLKASSGPKPNNKKSEISQADKDEAEWHKQFGNDHMRNQNNEKAIEAYSASISLNPTNPIYYCNRAAAYNAIGKYNDAIEDCQKAIELDSTYCKAYCRLGLAFTCLKDYQKAVSCYKKACELDPENLGYQRNYQLTLNNLQTVTEQEIPQDDSSPTTANSAMGSPNLMETAARLMNDPEVNTVLNTILGDVEQSSGGLDRLMQVGQTIVTRLQTSNPNILDGLRMQFQSAHNEEQSSPQNGYPDEENTP